MQVDLSPVAGADTPAAQSLHAITFTLISGNIRRFRRICEHIQSMVRNRSINYKHRMIIFEYKVPPSILGLQTRFVPRDVALPPPLQEPSDDLPKVYFDKKSIQNSTMLKSCFYSPTISKSCFIAHISTILKSCI